VEPSLCGISESIGKTILFGPLFGAFGMVVFAVVMAIFIVTLIVRIAIAALCVGIAPRHVHNMSECVRVSPFMTFLAGFFTIVLLPLACLLLLVTIIGIPFIPLVILLTIIAHLFGGAGIALWAGRLLPYAENRSIMHSALLGVLVLGVVRLIPVVGLLVSIVAGVMSIGVVVLTRFGSRMRTV
jgi:hypothetical protein